MRILKSRLLEREREEREAALAKERGVDAIIAQGTEAGGHTGEISSVVLWPEVIDAVGPERPSFGELVHTIRNLTGSRSLIVHVPSGEAGSTN